MKAAHLLIVGVLAVALPCSAKSDDGPKSPLVLRGKLTSLDLKNNESWGARFQGQFELQITNVSSDYIILTRRDPVFVGYSSPRWTDQGELIFTASENGLFVVRSAIDHEIPPRNSTITLGPHETYITHTTIPVEFHRSRPGRASTPFYPQSRRAQLELTLTGTPIMADDSRRNALIDDDSESETIEMEDLQKRWAATGKLYLEDIESEPIDIPLPPPPDSPPDSGLVLKGHVTSLETERTTTGARFEIEVELSFVNTGQKPLILLRPDAKQHDHGGLWYTTWGVSASREDIETGKYLYGGGFRPSNSRGTWWDPLRNALDQPKPPEDLVWVIQPGGATPPYRTTIDYSSSELPASNLWLEVTLPVWPSNIEPMASSDDNPFGSKLRKQWMAQGDLQLGHVGQDCNVTSEPFELVLPPQFKRE